MSGCRSWRRTLWAEVDGVLPAGRRERLLAHLERCPACREALAAARRVDFALAGEPLRSPSEEFEDEVLMKIVAGVPMGAAFIRRTSGPDASWGGASGEAGGPGDPMRHLDWWLLGGLAVLGILAVGSGIAVLFDALRAGAASASVAGDPTLTKTFSWLTQAPAVLDERIGALLRHRLAVPLGVMAGILAMTLGWVRLTLSRTAS
jgi:anti-sigma factor RsiW